MMRKKEPVTNAIKMALKDVTEIKARQFAGGDDVLGYVTASGNPNDFSVSLGASGSAKYLLTFTPSTSTYQPIVELFGYATTDQPNVLSSWTLELFGNPLEIQKVSPTQWYIALYNEDGSASHMIYCAFIFSGTDTGTFTIVAA